MLDFDDKLKLNFTLSIQLIVYLALIVYVLLILIELIGRVAMQKKIMSLLRMVQSPTQGNFQAWEDTFAYWEHATKFLVNYPKYKADEAMLTGGGGDGTGGLQRTFTKRRATHAPSNEHDLEVCIWIIENVLFYAILLYYLNILFIIIL